MGVFEEIRNWLSPEIKELKTRLEKLEGEVSKVERKVQEIDDVKERLTVLETLTTNILNEVKDVKKSQRDTEDRLTALEVEVKEIKRSQLKTEEKLSEIINLLITRDRGMENEVLKILLEMMKLITESKLELERRVERLEEEVFKKK